MTRPRANRLWNLLAVVVVLGAVATPQGTLRFTVAGEDRTTATADDVVRIDADLEAGDYVWQSSELEASDDGELLPFRLGFIVSISDPLNLITEAGVFSRLLPGQAIGVADGEQVNTQTLMGEARPYVAIELVPAGDADDSTAPAFPLEAGQHELSLQLFRPPSGDATEIRQLIQPILVLVQSGGFTLEPLLATGTSNDDVAPLGPGDSASLLFDTRLNQSGDGPAAFFVATLDDPGSDSEGESSIEPSSSSRGSTAASPSSSPSQAASSAEPSASAADDPPRSKSSAQSSPSVRPKVLK